MHQDTNKEADLTHLIPSAAVSRKFRQTEFSCNSSIDEVETHMIIRKAFFMWDAVVAWRDYIFSKDFYSLSKGNYLSNMLKLIESNIVDVRLQISSINSDWLGQLLSPKGESL